MFVVEINPRGSSPEYLASSLMAKAFLFLLSEWLFRLCGGKLLLQLVSEVNLLQ